MRRWLGVLCMLLCCGCSTSPHIQSAWHIIGDEDKSITYVAVLNRGNTSVVVQQLILNPVRDRSSWFEDTQHNGWELTVDKVLESGEMLVVEANKFKRGVPGLSEKWPDCGIPLEIDVRILLQPSLQRTEMPSPMPAALPLGWETRCSQKP